MRCRIGGFGGSIRRLWVRELTSRFHFHSFHLTSTVAYTFTHAELVNMDILMDFLLLG